MYFKFELFLMKTNINRNHWYDVETIYSIFVEVFLCIQKLFLKVIKPNLVTRTFYFGLK